ncbi:MAG: DUF3987 domain-containing protein [Jejuia sp.]
MTNLSNVTNLTYDIDLQNCEGNYEVQITKSLFKPKFQKKELYDVIEMIEKGAFEAPISKLRNLEKGSEEYDNIKVNLPVIYPSCEFKSNSTRDEEIANYHPIVQLDYDGIEDSWELETYKQIISNKPFTQTCFISPSGKGLKVFVKVNYAISNKEDYVRAFDAVRKHYDDALSFNSDEVIHNPNRACFLSYDPEVYFNCNPEPFRVKTSYVPRPEKAWELTENISEYKEGNRNNFLNLFANNANRGGVPIDKTIDYAIIKASGLSEREILSTVKSAYKNVEQFGQFAPKPVSSLSHLTSLSHSAEKKNIPDKFYSALPESIKTPAMLYEGRERDYFTLSLLPLLGATLQNNVWGRYNRSISHCNLYTMIVAPPASGKGVMNDAKHLFSAIEKQRRDMYKTFTIPGNISAAMLIQMMSANEGTGILCETEADTITNALNQDWGGFSDILRKGFHYEEVSYARKGDEEKIKIDRTNLSALITCTPGQVPKLMKEQSDGLYSRFLFYYSDEFTDFDLDIPNYNEEVIEKRLSEYKTVYRNVYDYFEQHTLEIRMESELWKNLIAHFKNKQTVLRVNGNTTTEDVVKRAGLICFRIAMLLMAIDCYDNNVKDDSVFVKKEYLDASIALIDYLMNHNTKVLNLVPNTCSKSNQNCISRLEYLDLLEDVFSVVDLTKKVGESQRQVYRYIENWITNGVVEKISKGKYKKS